MHNIFININSSTYNQHNNNKKIVLNNNLYENYKGINSFIYTNSNSHNKHNNRDEKDKQLKSNMHQNKNRKNKNDISIKDGSRISTSIIKKSNTKFCRNNILDEKTQIYKIMAIKKK